FQAEDGIRDRNVTGVQTCALPIFRGWQKMAWVLVERPDNLIQKLSRERFQVLLLCDGETDLSSSLLSESMKNSLQQCEAENIIRSEERRVGKGSSYRRGAYR